MDAFDKQILCDDEAVFENRALGVQAGSETATLELREEPDLTQL
jgi:hypothetical protein